MLLYQLKHDTDCMGRIEAARELIAIADPEVIDAMGEAVAKDGFWAVAARPRVPWANPVDRARDKLIEALGEPAKGHPKARRAVSQRTRHLQRRSGRPRLSKGCAQKTQAIRSKPMRTLPGRDRASGTTDAAAKDIERGREVSCSSSSKGRRIVRIIRIRP